MVDIDTNPRHGGESMCEWLSRVASERARREHPEADYGPGLFYPDTRDLADELGAVLCRVERLERAEELRRIRPSAWRLACSNFLHRAAGLFA